MKRDQILQMLDGVDDRFVTEAARFDPARRPTERSASMKTKRIVTLAIAAVLLLGLGAAAYAAGLIGPRAIVVEEIEEGGVVSLTQPQEIPEDQDPAVNAYVEASRAAWSEWSAWIQSYSDEWSPELPAVFDFPEGAASRMIEENGDGTYSVIFRNDEDEILEIRAAAQEDIDAYGAAWYAPSRYQGKYDFNYGCFDEESEAKLEEIAARYGLRLRGAGTHLYSGETFQTMNEWLNARYGTNLHNDYFSDPRYLTNEALAERISSQCCHGDFFRETPLGFDKFYAFDDGSFGVCWYVIFTPERQATCYVYNAAYGTLFSGREVSGVAYDLDSFAERSHLCPDGTEFTVLESPEQTYFYAYLENSYLCGTIGLGLSEAEVDAVLDSVNWSNIGK